MRKIIFQGNNILDSNNISYKENIGYVGENIDYSSLTIMEQKQLLKQ